MTAARRCSTIAATVLCLAAPVASDELVTEEVLGPVHQVRQYAAVSPEGLHYAYLSLDREQEKLFMVRDGKESPRFKRLGKDLVFSADGKRFGHEAHTEEGSYYVIDGQTFGPYENARGQTIRFGPDSNRLIFFVKKEGKWRLVVDGKEQAPLSDNYAKGSPILSPDGKRVAYHACLGEWDTGEHFVVVDGVEGPHYDRVSGLSFSPDSKHVVHKARKDDKWRVVLDGKEGPEYADIGGSHPVWSPDGNSMAYEASLGPWKEGRHVVVVDGVASPECDRIGKGNPVFSAEGKHIAYFAKRDDKWQLIVDGREQGPLWDNLAAGHPVFSPDGSRLAYHACIGTWEEGEHLAVIDGAEGSHYDGVSGLTFSPDSKRVDYRAKRGDKWHVVVDGVEGPHYDSVSSLKFSPDSKRVSYKAKRGEKWLAVVDGREGSEYASIAAGHPLFSPDSEHVAYEASRGPWDEGNHVLVVDGEVVFEGGWLRKGSPVFSSDSKHIVYAVKRDNKRFVILDGHSSGPYDEVLTVPPRFAGDAVVQYLAVRDGQLVRVTHRAPPPE